MWQGHKAGNNLLSESQGDTLMWHSTQMLQKRKMRCNLLHVLEAGKPII